MSNTEIVTSLNLSDFQLESKIGEGGSGEVFLCKCVINGQYVALKSISKSSAFSQSKMKQAITEKKILMNLSNPFITRLLGSFQTSSSLYLVLEFMEGGSLSYYLEKNIIFSLKQIQLFLAELVLALRYLHNQGIVFRDLKPENVLIDRDGHIKLSDFGLSKFLENKKSKSFCGTYEYLSPEMIKREFYSYSIDWWALGIIAYKLYFHRFPFSNRNLSCLFEEILNKEIKLQNNMDSNFRSLIEGLLEKDPEKRLKDDEIVKHPFFNDIDWEKVSQKEYECDFYPYYTINDYDSEFDEEKFVMDKDENHVESFSFDFLDSDSI